MKENNLKKDLHIADLHNADLHMHTTYSDGVLSVDELIDLCISKGLTHISITDHDTFKGSIEALSKEREITIIPGIELSTETNKESVHVLGYFPSIDNIKKFEVFLNKQRKLRVKRAFKIKKALKKYFEIDLDMSFIEEHTTITRGTIANEIMKQGLYHDREELFSKMLSPGMPAYFPSTKITTVEGIELIKKFGGLPVLAHPCLLKKNKAADIVALGVAGIEAIYALNKEGEEEYFKSLGRKSNILITAGSDFHMFDDDKHGMIGEVILKNEYLKIFLEKLGEL